MIPHLTRNARQLPSLLHPTREADSLPESGERRGLRELEPQYDELDILVYGNSIPSLISTCDKTLKRLRLSGSVCKFHTVFKPSRALSNATPWFSSLFHSHPREPPRTVRTHFRLVVLSRHLPHINHYLHEHPEDCIRPTPLNKFRRPALAALDTKPSILVDRLRESGYEHILELELRDRLEFAQEISNAGPDRFFPKFREKGRVNVLERAGGRTLYCSDSDS